jgi:flagellar hook-associated protein 3 FlgL
MGNFITRSNAELKSGLFDSVRKITSGKAVARPSDDPVSAARILRIDRLLRDLGSIDRSHQRVSSDLGIGDVSLAQVSSVIAMVKSLAIQMANTTVSGPERKAAGTEVQGYRDQLMDLANRRQEDGRYLFGGLAEGSPPYDEVTGAYVGSTSNREVEVAPGVFSEATVTGDQSFGGVGNEIFVVFDQLITAMNTNSTQGIADLLDPLDAKIEQTSQHMALMGTRINGLNETEGVSESLRIQYLQDKSIYQDIDITAEITRYTAQENSLTAVVEITRRLLANSLSAFLR